MILKSRKNFFLRRSASLCEKTFNLIDKIKIAPVEAAYVLGWTGEESINGFLLLSPVINIDSLILIMNKQIVACELE